jgi:hypothetical protein
MLPWPLVAFADAFVPAARYILLGSVATLVALTEGASGPVGLVVSLLMGWGLVTTLACWLLAWIIGRGLAGLPLAVQRATTWGGLGSLLVAGLAFEPYVTPFGRALRGGLLAVLS